MFFVYRGPQGRPTGARQPFKSCFQGQLICAETTWPKETRKKRPNSVFLGLKHLAHCPKSRYKPPFCAPPRPPLSPSGHHGHTRPRSSPPTTSPACSRKQSSIVLHFGSVRCLRSCAAAVRTWKQGPAGSFQNPFGSRCSLLLLRPPPILVTRASPNKHIRTTGERPATPLFPYNAVQ